MKSPKDKLRYSQWRINNPDKVSEQRRRRSQRKAGKLEPWVKPEPLTDEQKRARDIERKKRDYLKRKARLAADPEYAANFYAKEKARAERRYERLCADPVALAAKREKERERKRALVTNPKKPAMSKSEYLAHRREQNRLKLRRERGLPDDYVFPKSQPRVSKTGEKLPAKSKPQTRKQRLSAERARRAAEVAAAKARQPAPAEPVICPDPPELQALFAKASKGEPVRPHNPYAKKRSVFQIRGWI